MLIEHWVVVLYVAVAVSQPVSLWLSASQVYFLPDYKIIITGKIVSL